jgi:gas vesicle structural protein
MPCSSSATKSTFARQECTLLDLLDRLLYKGVVVRGDLTISVADVDLVYLQLNLLLTAVDRLPHLNHMGNQKNAEHNC